MKVTALTSLLLISAPVAADAFIMDKEFTRLHLTMQRTVGLTD